MQIAEKSSLSPGNCSCWVLFVPPAPVSFQPKYGDEPSAKVIRMPWILRLENLSWHFHLKLNTNMSHSQTINSSMFQFCASLNSDTQPHRDEANVKTWDALSPQIQSSGQYQQCVCTGMSSDLSDCRSGQTGGATDEVSYTVPERFIVLLRHRRGWRINN